MSLLSPRYLLVGPMVGLGLGLLVALQGSTAIADVGNKTVEGYSPVLILNVRQRLSLEVYMAEVVAPLRKHDLNRDGLDANDISIYGIGLLSRIRADQVSKILIYDLDNDGQVTADEVRVYEQDYGKGPKLDSGTPAMTKRLEKAVNKVMKFDSDDDGSITFDEMRQLNTTGSGTRTRYDCNKLHALLALDPNADAQLTADELTTLARHMYESIDSDKDGILSSAESKPVTRLRGQASSLLADPPCEFS